MQQHVSSSRSFCKSKILLSPSFRCYRNIRSTKLGAKIKDRLLHTHFNVANRPFVVAGGSLGANVSEASNGIFSSHHKTPLWKGEKKVKLFIEFHLFSSLSFKNLPYRNTQQTAFRSEIVKSGHSRLSIQK